MSNGDTWDAAWRADDTLLFQHNDGTGFDNGTYVHDRICKLQGTPQNPPSLLGTDLNPGVLSTTLNGSPCYSTGLYEVDGVLYHNVCYSQQTPGDFVFHHTSIIKSLDGGKNWINHLGQTNAMPPDNTNQCMFPSDNWGEVNFVKYGAGGAASDVDNAQTYVYLTAAWGDFRLARVARSDLPTLDPKKIQYYIGGDGMLDSSWINNIARSVAVPTPTVSPTAMVYDEVLGRYLMTSFASDSWVTPPIESSLRIMEAPHPWGPWTLLLDENVQNLEGDNLTWAFLMPKFTSADGSEDVDVTGGTQPIRTAIHADLLDNTAGCKKGSGELNYHRRGCGPLGLWILRDRLCLGSWIRLERSASLIFRLRLRAFTFSSSAMIRAPLSK